MNKNTTHRDQTDVIETVLQLLLDSNQNALAEGFRLLVNEAMKAERSYALNAAPYERTDERLGYANGFKPKTVATRLGSLTFQVPQVRGEIDFYPSALEKGLRSERALKLALAEMYVKGISTRKVTAVLEEMCGLEISSAQVGRDLRTIFNSMDRNEAETRLKMIAQKWEKTAPKLSAWMETNVPEALTVFHLPEKHHRRLRTTNALERLNLELKRRTRVAL